MNPYSNLPLVYSCSGASTAAQMANHIAVKLDRLKTAEMSCIAGVGGDVKPLVREAKSGRPIIVVDGCPLQCAAQILKRHGLTADKHYDLSKMGVKKKYHENFEPRQADRLLQRIRRDITSASEVIPFVSPERFPSRIANKRTNPGGKLVREIQALKRELNAIVLAHNYQIPEIQDVADFVGDSLGLAQQAATTGADILVFCGVHFMAETAKILNPDKVVLLPDREAGCSLEESCPADRLRALQADRPDLFTIAYVNCSAEVKALSDIICTSGNAVRIVESAPADREILFVPDENLGAWVTEQTGRAMTLWPGNCYAHVEFRRDSLLRLRDLFPRAKVVAHPESLKEVRSLADMVCSTEKMIAYCRESSAQQFVVATESGIIHRLKKECPNKEFLCAPAYDVMRMPTDGCRCSECRYMKLNTLEKLRDCMRNRFPRVEIPPEILLRARQPVERMLQVSGGTVGSHP